MTGNLQLIFRDVEFLIKLDVPFSEDSEEYKSVSELSRSPSCVSSFLQIINGINCIDDLHTVPWSGYLVTLCSRIIEAVECLEDVISIAQLSALKASVTKLISYIIIPSIPCDFPYPRQTKKSIQLSERQRIAVCELVIKTVLNLMKNGHTQGAVMRHYGELVGILLYLNVSSVSSCDMESSKLFYKQTLTYLLDDVHQSTVFTHLMILNSTKSDGDKVSRLVRKILNIKLQRPGGVLALLSATLLSDQLAASTQDVLKICNLLVGKHPDSFYPPVLMQVLELLKQRECKGHQVAAGCIAVLQSRDGELCEQLLISPLLAPLEKPCREGEIEITVESLKRWVDCAPPGTSLFRPLPLICLLYASIYRTPSALKSSVSDLLLSCFNRIEFPCPYLMSCIFPSHPGVVYNLTPTCSVVSVESDDPQTFESISKVILDFVSQNNLTRLKVEVYRSLLSYVVDRNSPLDRKLISSELLTELSSDRAILDSLSDEPKYLIDFLSDLFSKENFDGDSVSLGLVLLTVFLDDGLVHKKSNWEIIGKLKRPLIRLKQSNAIEIKTLADEILMRLSDLGIVRSETDNSLSKDHRNKADDNSKKNDRAKGYVADCDYEEAYKESMDPHLPVRAHALRTFAKLLRAKDKTTMSNKTTILNIFKANLDDNDSYLYLSAIEGLSSLASMFPDDVISILCEEFISRKDNTELRLKIGQVIVKTTNIMGEMGAVYKKELLSALLAGAIDADPLVRASSLSNIGEIAKILSFRIYDFLVEIFHCVESIVDTDKELEPRRAAVMLISLLLQGLGKHTFTVLEDVLPELYRKLKVVYRTDKDEVTRLHAQIALDHLSDITKSLLFAKPDLTKRISILDIS